MALHAAGRRTHATRRSKARGTVSLMSFARAEGLTATPRSDLPRADYAMAETSCAGVATGRDIDWSVRQRTAPAAATSSESTPRVGSSSLKI